MAERRSDLTMVIDAFRAGYELALDASHDRRSPLVHSTALRPSALRNRLEVQTHAS